MVTGYGSVTRRLGLITLHKSTQWRHRQEQNLLTYHMLFYFTRVRFINSSSQRPVAK